MKTKLIMGAALLACFAGTVLHVEAAVTNYVDGARSGSSDNSGLTWENAFTNLQEAIGIATINTELWVAQGTYYPTNVSDIWTVSNSSFRLKTGMGIYGGFTNGMTSLTQRDWMEYATILSGDIDKNGIVDSNNVRHIVYPGTNSVVDGCYIMFAWGVVGNKDGAAVTTYISNNLYSSTNYILRNCVIAQNAGFGQNGSQGSVVCDYMAAGNSLISNCIFMANYCSTYANAPYLYTIMANYAHTLNVKNCLFIRNGGGCNIRKHSSSGTIGVQNCTFLNNEGSWQIFSAGAPTWTVKNSIFWGNSGLSMGAISNAVSGNGVGTASYCDIQASGGSGTNWTLGSTNIVDGGGNLDTNPLFVGGPTGTWTEVSSYNSGTFRTTLTDSNASFGDLRGKFLNPKKASTNSFYILSSNPTQIIVRGNASAVGTSGNAYEVLDAHERSTSPCIDAGDPADSFALEPNPNGSRINMGAYGNTPQASFRTSTSAGLLIRVQ